ncbi:hypothetical protein HDG37_007644 [Paraburkholderia sp. MM5384-R2]|nr:hypothetical protein [Paraburkholderia sp. MM5384-R2]
MYVFGDRVRYILPTSLQAYVRDPIAVHGIVGASIMSHIIASKKIARTIRIGE